MENMHSRGADSIGTISTREKVAVAVSSSIIVISLLYWTVQIRGVLELLELAYG